MIQSDPSGLSCSDCSLDGSGELIDEVCGSGNGSSCDCIDENSVFAFTSGNRY